MNAASSFCFFLGGLLIGFGLLYKLYPPKNWNFWWSYGLRFRFAMRSIETWKATHKFIAFPLIYAGVFIILVGVVPFTTSYKWKFHSLFIITMSIILLLYGFTIAHVNKHFDKNGKRRNEK